MTELLSEVIAKGDAATPEEIEALLESARGGGSDLAAAVVVWLTSRRRSPEHARARAIIDGALARL